MLVTDYRIPVDAIIGTYRKVFPDTSLLLNGFINRTEQTKDGSIMVASDGTFYYNPVWCKQWLTNPTRFQDALVHEISHPILLDTSREQSDIANVGADIVINAMNYRLGFSKCELQSVMYSPTDFREALLRPKAKPSPETIELYKEMYGDSHGYTKSKIRNPLEVTEALRIISGEAKGLVDWAETATKCIGSHAPCSMGGGTSAGGGAAIMPMHSAGLPAEVVGDLAASMEVIIEKERGRGGYHDYFNQMVVRILRSKQTLRQEVIEDFCVVQNINRIKNYFDEKSIIQSPVPTAMSRKDALYMSMGHMPTFFSSPDLNRQEEESQGVHIYIDVSGSVHRDLPYILGILHNMRDNIEKIYCFSNRVWEVSMKKLREKGDTVKSTGGTDFDCVIEHACSNNVKKAMVFTDGYAKCTEANQRKAVAHIAKMGVVYFGRTITRNNWIQEQYGIGYRLDELLQDKHGNRRRH